MLYRSILTSLLFILEVVIARTIVANGLPTADPFSSQLRVPPAAAAGDVDEDDDYSLVVSRGSDILTSTQTETGHYREITVTLTAFNETFVLDLKLNTYLLASTYIEKAITNLGEMYNDVNHVTGHCYYTGEVRNRSQSSAAISTCKGITGYFAIGNVSFHIEPLGDDLYGRHRVSRNRDNGETSFKCGTKGQPIWMSNNNLTDSFDRSSHRIKRSFLHPQDADRIERVVEVYVANDNSQFRSRSSNIQNVYRRTKDIINAASLAYQPLGIYLVLVGVEVWTDEDRFPIPASNSANTLFSWYTYREISVNPFHYNDNGVLITNVAFDGDVVGVATRGSMCSNKNSGSMISDVYRHAEATGTILAHEMGHNFGLQHDNDRCNCDDSYTFNTCIMNPSPSSYQPATNWSSCSRTQFAISFKEGVDICLYNIPQTIFQPSTDCGNGIVEDGEQCDCGNAPRSECNTTCCNRCQLTASAACASGKCCDTSRCQIKSSGSECRSKSGECDLPEYCNGVDISCPTDDYKPDGTECTNIESAYCYQGKCQSHRSQCELIFGSETSDDICYTQLNGAAGGYDGNCGITWTNTGSFDSISCDVKDVMCGRLQCKNIFKPFCTYRICHFVSSTPIGSSSCKSVIFGYGAGTRDPGLVPNGAKCGDRQMCVNQKCVNVTVPATTTSTTSSTSSLSSSSSSSSSSTTTPTATSTTTTLTTASTTTGISVTTTSTSTSATTTKTSTNTRSTSQTSTSPSTETSVTSSTKVPSASTNFTTTSTTKTSIFSAASNPSITIRTRRTPAFTKATSPITLQSIQSRKSTKDPRLTRRQTPAHARP